VELSFKKKLLLMLDLTGKPIMVCICGSKLWQVNVMWDTEERSVSWYDLRQTCVVCGAIATAPTPIDEEI
jgi:hypothetical protein